MTKKEEIKISPGPVCETLFLPVIARALESKKPEPLLSDQKAIEIIESANLDLPKLSTSITELCHVAWIVRYKCFDRLIRDFIRRYPYSTIVNIGCGLDTTYERVNNGSVLWYDLDIPEVIELRKSFMNETSTRKFISSSFLQNNWFSQVIFKDNILFIAGGVFCYFEEREIKKFLLKLSSVYPSCELIFDVTSPAGIKTSNNALKKVHFDNTLLLKWGLKDVKTILSWNPRFRLLGKYYTFKHSNITLSTESRILSWIFDMLDIQYILHLKIRFDYKHFK
jgi:O-methyltransferase involved in polyketide biosynthesis